MDLHILLSVLAEMRRYRQRDHWTRQQLESYQADALSDLRAYAYVHSLFYQRFHQGLTDAPLEELPVLTKAMLKKMLTGLRVGSLLGLLAVLVTACGMRDASTIVIPTAHLGATGFIQDSIALQKGEMLDLVDDSVSPHQIENGSWVVGVARPNEADHSPATRPRD